jgi:hypothetical protein
VGGRKKFGDALPPKVANACFFCETLLAMNPG